MPQDESTPKLHIDSDWKAEAQAEKERLAEKEKESEAEGSPGDKRGAYPDADFKSLVGILASQAIMGLGAMADPQSGRVVVDLDGSRFSIDLLGVLEEKTAGNLSDEEATDLSQVLTELRARYVQITQAVAQQSAAAVEPGAEGGGVVSG